MPSASVDHTRQILYVAEGLTTPGVTPMTPTLKHTGSVSIEDAEELAHEEVRVIGINTLYADLIMGKTDTFTLNYYMYDTQLFRQGILFNGAVGGADESITVFESKKVAGPGTPELFRLRQGCYTTGVTLTIGKVYRIAHTFRCIRMTNWLDSTALTALIGAPVYPAVLSATPKTNLDARISPTFADVDPFVLNGVNVDLDTATVTVGYAIAEKTPLGHFDPKNLRALNQAISITLSTWQESAAMLGDMRNFLSQNATMKLWEAGTTDAVLSINGIKMNSYRTSDEGGGSDFTKESYGGSVSSLDIPLLT
jgi:hypothetical protein